MFGTRSSDWSGRQMLTVNSACLGAETITTPTDDPIAPSNSTSASIELRALALAFENIRLITSCDTRPEAPKHSGYGIGYRSNHQPAQGHYR